MFPFASNDSGAPVDGDEDQSPAIDSGALVDDDEDQGSGTELGSENGADEGPKPSTIIQKTRPYVTELLVPICRGYFRCFG